MDQMTRREAIRVVSAVGLAAMGLPVARARAGAGAVTARYRDAYEQVVLADAPVAYWRLGERAGPAAVDATGHGHHGTYRGHPTLGLPGAIRGESDTASGFHGQEYVEIPDSVHFSQPASRAGLTVEAWMRPDVLDFPGQPATPGADPYVHWLGKGVTGHYEWGFRFYSRHKDPEQRGLSSRPNRISAYLWNPAGGTGAGAYFQDPLVTGRWIHIVACYEPGDLKTRPAAGVLIYKDGQFRLGPPAPGTLYSNPAFQILPAHGTAPVRLGTRDLGSFLRGGLDEVAIYPYVLSARRIQEHYRICTGS